MFTLMRLSCMLMMSQMQIHRTRYTHLQGLCWVSELFDVIQHLVRMKGGLNWFGKAMGCPAHVMLACDTCRETSSKVSMAGLLFGALGPLPASKWPSLWLLLVESIEDTGSNSAMKGVLGDSGNWGRALEIGRIGASLPACATIILVLGTSAMENFGGQVACKGLGPCHTWQAILHDSI